MRCAAGAALAVGLVAAPACTADPPSWVRLAPETEPAAVDALALVADEEQLFALFAEIPRDPDGTPDYMRQFAFLEKRSSNDLRAVQWRVRLSEAGKPPQRWSMAIHGRFVLATNGNRLLRIDEHGRIDAATSIETDSLLSLVQSTPEGMLAYFGMGILLIDPETFAVRAEWRTREDASSFDIIADADYFDGRARALGFSIPWEAWDGPYDPTEWAGIPAWVATFVFTPSRIEPMSTVSVAQATDAFTEMTELIGSSLLATDDAVVVIVPYGPHEYSMCRAARDADGPFHCLMLDRGKAAGPERCFAFHDAVALRLTRGAVVARACEGQAWTWTGTSLSKHEVATARTPAERRGAVFATDGERIFTMFEVRPADGSTPALDIHVDTLPMD